MYDAHPGHIPNAMDCEHKLPYIVDKFDISQLEFAGVCDIVTKFHAYTGDCKIAMSNLIATRNLLYEKKANS